MGPGDDGAAGRDAADARPEVAPSAWTCPRADAGAVPIGCAPSGLFDLHATPGSPHAVNGGPPQAFDINDSGDVLLGGASMGPALWLSNPGCLVDLEVPLFSAANLLVLPMGYHSVAGINNRSSVAATLYLTHGVAAVICNGTCTALTVPPSMFFSSNESYARALSDADDVIGTATWTPQPGTTNPILWAGGVPGGVFLDASVTAINAAGQMIGTPIGTAGRCIFREAGVTRDLGTLGGTFCRPIAINDAGQVVGSSTTATGALHPFIWEAGVMRDLGTLGGTSAVALAINARGQVAGSSSNAAGQVHAFFWDGSVMRDLGTLGGVASIPGVPSFGATDWQRNVLLPNTAAAVSARFVNDAGQVAGTSTTAAGDLHAFLWDAGVMRDLGTLGGTKSYGVAINARGQVVGNSTTPTDSSDSNAHPFLFDPALCPTSTP